MTTADGEATDWSNVGMRLSNRMTPASFPSATRAAFWDSFSAAARARASASKAAWASRIFFKRDP